MSLNSLNQGTPSAASQVPFYDPDNGGDRRASLSAIAGAVADILGLSGQSGEMETQFVTIVGGPATVTAAPTVPGNSVFVVLTTTIGSTSNITYQFPPVAECRDGQEVTWSNSAAMTSTLTNGNGASVVGAGLGSMVAGGWVRYRFVSATSTWYRIG